jgi:hypothetical protein
MWWRVASIQSLMREGFCSKVSELTREDLVRASDLEAGRRKSRESVAPGLECVHVRTLWMIGKKYDASRFAIRPRRRIGKLGLTGSLWHALCFDLAISCKTAQ